jgi:hypothetical protein
MKNASANSSRRQGSRLRGLLNTAVIAGAIVLPLLALSPDTHAEDAKSAIPASGTLKEVVTRGSVLIIDDAMQIDVAYTPDGKFSAMDGQVKGTWRIEGDTLCTTTSFQPVETCTLYPRDKKSGDTFEIMSDQGMVRIRIK